MEKFVTSLRKKYKEKLLQREEEWLPISATKFINLELVEAEKQKGFRAGLPQHGGPDKNVKRTPILHSDLFNSDKKPVRKVVVEGNPGTGKTTLCTMLTEEWAEGKILAQFDCVLLLPLREKSVASATTLPQLFKLLHSSERIRASAIEEMEEKEGEGVLIIADGWDELDSENQSRDSLLYNLLFGSVLPFASVLLTSRPSASAPLHDKPFVDCFVEVVGFNEENIRQYIEAEFELCPDKAASLIEQLENNPLVHSVCSVPLNCAIICYLWDTLKQVLPTTLTELYTQVILNVILRDIRKNVPEFHNLSLKNFDSLPSDLQETFWLTCRFAYECLSRDKIVFSEEELAVFFPEIIASADKVPCFGLLQSARSLLPVGQGLSFHFAHLTFQEFLAALHLVTLPTDEKLKAFERHGTSSRFCMVWRFLFGLGSNKQEKSSEKVVCLEDGMLDVFITALIRNHKDFSLFPNDASSFIMNLLKGLTFDEDDVAVPLTCEEDRLDRLLVCHCALESRDEATTVKLAKRFNGVFRRFATQSIAYTPHDVAAFIRIFGYTTECMKGVIDLRGCGLSDKQLGEVSGILASTNGKIQIKELSLSANKLSDKSVSLLFEKASASFSSLEYLTLSFNNISNIVLPPYKSLSSLYLHGCTLSVDGVQSLESAAEIAQLPNLKYLVLSYVSTGDPDINGALMTTLLHAIASHCPQLIDLGLNEIELHACAAYVLAEATVQLAHSRESITFHFDKFNTEVATAFSNHLYNAKFNELIPKKRSYRLELSQSSLGHDGLLALSRMLSNDACPITSLNLTSTEVHGISFTISDLLKLRFSMHICKLRLLPENHTLTSLDLRANNFTGKSIKTLADCINVCQALENLYTNECSLTSANVIELLTLLKSQNRTWFRLKSWNLSNNSIDLIGLYSLKSELPKLFPCLVCIIFEGNPVPESQMGSRGRIDLRKNPYSSEAEEDRIRQINLRSWIVSKQMKQTTRQVVLYEWKKNSVPPVRQELLKEFWCMWEELLWEMCYFANAIIRFPELFGLPLREVDDRTFNAYMRANDLENINLGNGIEYNVPSEEEELLQMEKATANEQAEHQPTDPELASSTTVGESTPQSPPDVNTHSTQNTSSGGGRQALTIEDLKDRLKVTGSDLERQIETIDMFKMAAYFDDVDIYLAHLGLTPSQRTDIKDLAFRRNIQTAMSEALRLWREPNPYKATYRALIELLLGMGKGEVAVGVCTVCKEMTYKTDEH